MNAGGRVVLLITERNQLLVNVCILSTSMLCVLRNEQVLLISEGFICIEFFVLPSYLVDIGYKVYVCFPIRYQIYPKSKHSQNLLRVLR